jgi:hypothetical protein
VTNNQRTRLKTYLSTISIYLRQAAEKLQHYCQAVKHKLQHGFHCAKLHRLLTVNRKVMLIAVIASITLISAIAIMVFNKSNPLDSTRLTSSNQQNPLTPTQAEINNITHLPAETLIFSDIQAQLLALHRAIENLQHQLNTKSDNPREHLSLQQLAEQQQLTQQAIQQLRTLLESPSSGSDPIAQQNTQSIEATLQQLANDMRQAHSELQQLREALLPEHYLSAEHLPFSVNAIEIWNEKIYVRLLDKTPASQSHNENQSKSNESDHSSRNSNGDNNNSSNKITANKESLLLVGERQGQWQITHIDVDKQMVILRNQQHAYVRVTL